jgi:hypothetical protein
MEVDASADMVFARRAESATVDEDPICPTVMSGEVAAVSPWRVALAEN